MQSSINLDPTKLSSSPLRQLYEDLSTFERNRDWSKATRGALLKKAAARAQPPQQNQSSPSYESYQDLYGALSPSTPLTSTSNTLEDIERMLGIPVDGPNVSTQLTSIDPTITSIDPSQLFWPSTQEQPQTSTTTPFSIPTPTSVLEASPDKDTELPPQIAELMTPREIAAFNMLKMFQEISEKRIESWGRIARLMILQPMDGFATVETQSEV